MLLPKCAIFWAGLGLDAWLTETRGGRNIRQWPTSLRNVLLSVPLDVQPRAEEAKFNRELRGDIQQELVVSGETKVRGVYTDRFGH